MGGFAWLGEAILPYFWVTKGNLVFNAYLGLRKDLVFL